MPVTTLEPVSDVAGVGAVLAVAVSIGRERFPAAGAGECVERLPVDAFGMAVPPSEAAGVGAEPRFLSTGFLCERFPAALAVRLARRIPSIGIGEPSGEVVPSAIGRHLAFGEPERTGYRGISMAFPAKASYLFLLLCVHENTSRRFPLEKGPGV